MESSVCRRFAMPLLCSGTGLQILCTTLVARLIPSLPRVVAEAAMTASHDETSEARRASSLGADVEMPKLSCIALVRLMVEDELLLDPLP